MNSIKKLPKLIFLTDSHGMYFLNSIKKNLLKPFVGDVCIAHGATISGLKNPNSFTAASKTYKDFLVNKPKNSYIFMHLGEVDCGILMWLKAKKNGSDIKSECTKTIDIYMNFISELKLEGFNNIIVTSATLPTISDDDHVGEIISLRRRQVDANFKERTELTLYFNKELEKYCMLKNIDFIDPTIDFINSNTKFTHVKYRNKKRGDHHMDKNMAAVIWAKYLRSYLFTRFDVNVQSMIKIAQQNTFVKKLNIIAKELPDEMFLEIDKGAIVEIEVLEEIGNTLLLNRMLVNNIVLDSDFKFIHAPHFI